MIARFILSLLRLKIKIIKFIIFIVFYKYNKTPLYVENNEKTKKEVIVLLIKNYSPLFLFKMPLTTSFVAI